jgi:hypothetical protein
MADGDGCFVNTSLLNLAYIACGRTPSDRPIGVGFSTRPDLPRSFDKRSGSASRLIDRRSGQPALPAARKVDRTVTGQGHAGEGHNPRAMTAMTQNETQIDRIRKYLQQLTLQERSHLLAEIERLQMYGDDMPGSDVILSELRAEFRQNAQAGDRLEPPARHFFQPLEPVLVDHAPERANNGQISRGSLSTIWEWMSHNLLRAMANDYTAQMKQAIAANNPQKARQVATDFQAKTVKYLEDTLASPDGARRVQAGLATYTSLPATFGDLTKMLGVLRARDALAQFNEALPPKIAKFEGAQLAKVRGLLDALSAKHAAAIPFALTIVARRLKTPWQLIRLATKTAPSKAAADIAAAPYAITVSMVLDQIDEKRWALRDALRSTRVVIARDILVAIYDIEYALRVRIDLDGSDWGHRLDDLMQTVAAVVEAEVKRIPNDVQHVLGSRSLRSHESLSGRLAYLAWKGRDAVTGVGAYCRRLVPRFRSS